MQSGEREIISHIWSLVLAELVNTTRAGGGQGRGEDSLEAGPLIPVSASHETFPFHLT